MASVSVNQPHRKTEALNAIFAPPQWVQLLIGSVHIETSEPLDGITVTVAVASHTTFVRVHVANACDSNALSFQRKTVQAYALIANALHDRSASQPVRFWNQIPRIRDEMGDGIDRYMVFNSGRLAAFHDWFGAEAAIQCEIATATGVGHNGRDLVIDALAADRPGLYVQNPRQQRPSCYSSRYGPIPPCFARATLARWGGDEPRVLIGGTASVRGEESFHEGDLRAQTEETFRNLMSLIRASTAVSSGGASPSDDVELLAAFESARVYYVHDRHGQEVRRLVQQHLPYLRDVEYFQADICRPELLIEIEGVVRMGKLHAEP